MFMKSSMKKRFSDLACATLAAPHILLRFQRLVGGFFFLEEVIDWREGASQPIYTFLRTLSHAVMFAKRNRNFLPTTDDVYWTKPEFSYLPPLCQKELFFRRRSLMDSVSCSQRATMELPHQVAVRQPIVACF